MVLRKLSFCFWIVICIFDDCAYASTPEYELQNMIAHDMDGDPTIRLKLAFSKKEKNLLSDQKFENKRIAFELDADELLIATDWKLDNNDVNCDNVKCVLTVNYIVVAITTGRGLPSWNQINGREIQILSKPTDKKIEYTLECIDGNWKLRDFPIPIVSLNTLKKFFEKEISAAESVTIHGRNDRAIKNHAILNEWRNRQFEILQKISN